MRTETNDDPTTFLFEVEGKPRRHGLRKQRSYVAFYQSAVVIELDGTKDRYTVGDIYDIFIKEPVIEDMSSRTVEIDFVEEGEDSSYELEESTFPGLASLVEHALQRDWSHILRQWDYPKTIQWFLGICAPVAIASEQNWRVFGNHPQVDNVSDQREVLYESWGLHNGKDLAEMLPKLFAGRAVKKWRKKNGIDKDQILSGADAVIELQYWTWDLQRLVWLAQLGLCCRYLDWSEALEWCLKAGGKLQAMFRDWDGFMDAYLRAYAEWAGEDLNDPSSEAGQRAAIWQHYSQMPNHPWKVPWNQPLSMEW